jgi:hypothetical protein
LNYSTKFYDVYQSDSLYISQLQKRFYYLKNCGIKGILKNTNYGSNASVQGKVNFFNVNNTIYCINAYYLQNFIKIKKKNKKEHFKKKKKKYVSYRSLILFCKPKRIKYIYKFYTKVKQFRKRFDNFKIKNYKLSIKYNYYSNENLNYVFSNPAHYSSTVFLFNTYRSYNHYKTFYSRFYFYIKKKTYNTKFQKLLYSLNLQNYIYSDTNSIHKFLVIFYKNLLYNNEIIDTGDSDFSKKYIDLSNVFIHKQDFEIKPLEIKNLDIMFDKESTENVPLTHTQPIKIIKAFKQNHNLGFFKASYFFARIKKQKDENNEELVEFVDFLNKKFDKYFKEDIRLFLLNNPTPESILNYLLSYSSDADVLTKFKDMNINKFLKCLHSYLFFENLELKKKVTIYEILILSNNFVYELLTADDGFDESYVLNKFNIYKKIGKANEWKLIALADELKNSARVITDDEERELKNDLISNKLQAK